MVIIMQSNICYDSIQFYYLELTGTSQSIPFILESVPQQDYSSSFTNELFSNDFSGIYYSEIRTDPSSC
jgi:hypothetical protein